MVFVAPTPFGRRRSRNWCPGRKDRCYVRMSPIIVASGHQHLAVGQQGGRMLHSWPQSSCWRWRSRSRRPGHRVRRWLNNRGCWLGNLRPPAPAVAQHGGRMVIAGGVERASHGLPGSWRGDRARQCRCSRDCPGITSGHQHLAVAQQGGRMPISAGGHVHRRSSRFPTPGRRARRW